MKIRKIALLGILIATIFAQSVVLCSCSLFSNEGKPYTIQYTDDAGTHQLSVTGGMPYSLEEVPSRTGYEFLGLFDSETGGTQYVAANGASLEPFKGKKNLVLFPQFEPKKYTFVLNYQGAAVTGMREFEATYGSSLPELPNDLVREHYDFSGWYTEENGGGVQIADSYGLLPLVSVMTEKNFDMNAEHTDLYAGFTLHKYSVTYHFGGGLPDETANIEYGTPVASAVPKTRVDGKAPLNWSLTQDGEVYNGKVTCDCELYALEYAPVAELDTDGGEEINPVVARAGAELILPTPVKSAAKFLYWADMQGQRYDGTKMPENGLSLKAVWKAKLEFDENGGNGVEDIAADAGAWVRLPVPIREGYVFAGWYTTDKTPYTSNVMPAEGIVLKAGWYKEMQKTLVLVPDNQKLSSQSDTFSADKRIKIDLSDTFNKIPENGVQIELEVKFWWGNDSKNCKAWGQIGLYEGPEISSSNEIAKKALSHSDDHNSYYMESFMATYTIHSRELYLYYAAKGDLHISLSGGYGLNTSFGDITMSLIYPDTEKLYL